MARLWSELPTPPELESEVLAFWKANGIFAKSMAQRKDGPRFVFYEGPPTANGIPHNGHVLTRVIKDLLPRYRTMRGDSVPRIAGWDTHGLPVEVEVEKELGIHGKAAIEEFGVEAFSRRCIASVFRYTQEWEEMSAKVGFWVDLEGAYVTYHRSYVESVWWALSTLFKKGLLYQGHKIVWWWPQGGTALSSGEVGDGYRTVDDPSLTVRFRLPDHPGCSLLAWTTTPWTLPSNVALAVKPDADYAWIQHGEEQLIVAAALAAQVPGEVVRVVKGADLVGLRYEPLYRFADPGEGKSWEVVAGDHVTLDATGIVHTAPAFGEDDFALAKKLGLGFLQLVGPDGRFVAGTGFLEGRYCKEADKDIVRELKERGLVFKSETLRHEYPFCPRADQDPLIQYARPAWFIRTTALKEAALANNAAVNWLPATIRDGRFGDFLRNNVDWALSRERFWGTPLNIWSCESCGHRVAPASAAEIEALAPNAFDPSVDRDLQVHKPWIDRVILPCAACGGQMRRVPEVIDCWFDSGCMPFAQLGWPHQNHEQFRKSYPADFISEAVDQTRGWFYSLMMIATLLFDEETCADHGLSPELPRPFRNCVVLGHVCDADGKKESKSKGNYTSPDLVLKGRMKVQVVADPGLERGQLGLKAPQVKGLGFDSNERFTAFLPDGSGLPTGEGLALVLVARPVKGKDTAAMHPDDIAALGLRREAVLVPPFAPPGADAFRWLFYASNPPWNNTRISLKAILEGQREFLFRLKNVHQFLVLHRGAAPPQAPRARHLLDRWILHGLARLIDDVTGWLDRYLIFEPARAIQDFVDGLSNWWLRRSRSRFDDPGEDGVDARDTLLFVLTTLSRVVAPFVPFIAEGIWRSLRADGDAESVHLTDWPASEARFLDEALAGRMALVREVSSLGLAARSQVGVRVRQPLAAAEVLLARPEAAGELGELLELIRDELNVRELRFPRDPERFVAFKVKPDFKVLGKKLGKDMKACQDLLRGLPGAAVRQQVLDGGLRMDLPAGTYVLGPEEIVVEVSPLPGYQAASSPSAVVALSSALDEDLREEGLMREVVSKVQGVRKSLGLGYDEQVWLRLSGGARTERMKARFGAVLTRSTGAEFGAAVGDPLSFTVDGEELVLVVSRC